MTRLVMDSVCERVYDLNERGGPIRRKTFKRFPDMTFYGCVTIFRKLANAHLEQVIPSVLDPPVIAHL